MPKPKHTGGRKLREFLRKAKAAQARSKGANVGWFAESRYPDEKPVALVAALTEFGQEGRAERPNMRGAIASTTRSMRDVLRRGIDPKTMELDEQTAAQVGEVLADGIRANIRAEPPNVDTGKMLSSVDVKVTDP